MSSSICSCCLMIVSFNCRIAFVVCSLSPVDDVVCFRTLFSSLLKNSLKLFHVFAVVALSSHVSQLRSNIPVFLMAIYAFRRMVLSGIGSFPASAKILHSSMWSYNTCIGVVGSHGSLSFASFSVNSSSLTVPYFVLMYVMMVSGVT